MCLSLQCEGDTPCGDSLIQGGGGGGGGGEGGRLRFCVHFCMESVRFILVGGGGGGGYMLPFLVCSCMLQVS